MTAPTITPAAAAPAPQLIRQFIDLQSTLERYDTTLTSWERHGSTYPRTSVPNDYDMLAQRLDDARTQLRDLRPEAGDLHARLQRDTLFIARTAGKIDVMAQHQTTFGRGWSNTLDQAIVDVRAAVDLLLSTAPAA